MEGVIYFYFASRENGYLSNLFECPVKYRGKQFRSSEEAYQFTKVKAPALAEWLISAPDQKYVALAGHAIFKKDCIEHWDSLKLKVMEGVVNCKFRQNEDLKKELLSTGKCLIVEAAFTDSFWGCGPDMKGENNLGKILMKIRSEIREEMEE